MFQSIVQDAQSQSMASTLGSAQCASLAQSIAQDLVMELHFHDYVKLASAGALVVDNFWSFVIFCSHFCRSKT
jgi:hypothetical protein